MDAISRTVVGYLLNSFWQVTLIAALALLCSFYLRRLPGRYRHSLWVLCLGACVLVPAAAVVRQVRTDAQGEPSAKVTGGEDRKLALVRQGGDRKSTRLNSSHVEISYAVFCLKKKTGVWLER